MYLCRIIIPSIFSAGFPSLSYIARIKRGTITIIIRIADISFPRNPLVPIYNGTPTKAAAPKHMSCLLVKFSATFVLLLIFEKFFGAFADIAIFLSFHHINVLRSSSWQGFRS